MVQALRWELSRGELQEPKAWPLAQQELLLREQRVSKPQGRQREPVREPQSVSFLRL